MYKTDLTSVYYDIHRKGIVGEMVPITSTIRWPAMLDHDATSAYVHIAMKVFTLETKCNFNNNFKIGITSFCLNLHM